MQVMANIEDAQDVMAARKAQEEFRAEVAEFDETISSSTFVDVSSSSSRYLELINGV